MGRRAKVNAKRRNRRIITISVAATIVAVIVVLALIVEASQANSYSKYIGLPVSSGVMSQLTGVSDSTLAAIGHPSSVTAPSAISGSPLSLNGKPEVLYVGGEFCPYCAVERWSMIVALSHFGNFSGIEYMQSSSTDVNPNTPTFTFRNSTFTSNYIAFVPVEEYNRASATAQPLSSEQQSIYGQYGACPSTSTTGIPFIDIANAYVVNCGAQFSLPQIAGDNWTTVASQLNDPSSIVAQPIDGAANTLINAICKADGMQPSNVCGSPYATFSQAHPTFRAVTPEQSLLALVQVRDHLAWTE